MISFPTLRIIGADVTFINGGGSGTVIYAAYLSSSTVIEGFTIQNGTGSDYGHGCGTGGGIYFWNVDQPSIKNCIIRDHSANIGGGIYLGHCAVHIQNCQFINNHATGAYPQGRAGGMYGSASTPEIENCIFTGNTAESEGGGLYITSAAAEGSITG